ncbi:guanyl-specific ribonuclease f1 [Fusarium oxysporum f. sp. phaseoli]
MLFFKSIASLAALVSLAVAGPIESRQSATTCGSTNYSASQVRAAANAACQYYQNDDTAGSSTYPHTYNNREGFDFIVDGPYQEFPIKSGGVYTGGKMRNGFHSRLFLTFFQALLVLTVLSSTPTASMLVPLLTLVLPATTLLDAAALTKLSCPSMLASEPYVTRI